MQARFVSGRLTPVWLFTASLLLWVVRVVADAFLGAEMTFAGYFVPLLLSLLCYVAATVILDVSFLFERRVRWLSAMFMWLAAVSSSVCGVGLEALAVLFLAIVVYRLFACKLGDEAFYGLFSVFVTVGCASLILPQFILLLPLFIVYSLLSTRGGIRGFLAISLGFSLPYLLIYGVDTLFPGVVPWKLMGEGLVCLRALSLRMPVWYQGVLVLLQLLVLVPFVVIFMNSAVPGKPFLRRRLTFLIYLNVALLLLSLLYNDNFPSYYMMSLPTVAVMVGYIFTIKVSKPMNWFFIVVNILWFSLFPFGLCLKFL